MLFALDACRGKMSRCKRARLCACSAAFCSLAPAARTPHAPAPAAASRRACSEGADGEGGGGTAVDVAVARYIDMCSGRPSVAFHIARKEEMQTPPLQARSLAAPVRVSSARREEGSELPRPRRSSHPPIFCRDGCTSTFTSHAFLSRCASDLPRGIHHHHRASSYIITASTHHALATSCRHRTL